MHHFVTQISDGARSASRLLLALVLLAAIAGCGELGGEAVARAASGADVGPARLTAERGTFERRVVLTGDLEAAEAASLVVPRMPSWQVEVRWLAEAGATVEAGEPVLELDSSSFTSELEDLEITLAEKQAELESREVQALLDEREKLYQLAETEAALEKARLDAAVPAELVSRREYEELQLALEKAQLERAKAQAALETSRETAAADIAVQRIDIAKSQREIDDARRAVEELTLSAPRAGLFLVAEHPWHDRTIQVGDQVWVGMTVARLPELDSLVVKASLPDVDDGEIAAGMPAEVVLDARPGRVFRGRVTEIGSIAQEEGQASLRRFFEVEVVLDEIDTTAMIPGMSARVEVVAERRPDVLLVPRAALVERPDGAVAHLEGGGTREVDLGPCDELTCVVEAGLEVGESLAPAPPAALVAGEARTGGEVPS